MSYAPASGYEYAIAQPNPERKGPNRFEEGVVTDTDVPQNFMQGAYGDPNGPLTTIKSPMETQRERAHVGAAAWILAPQHISEFAQGAFTDHPTYERVAGSETRLYAPNIARVG